MTTCLKRASIEASKWYRINDPYTTHMSEEERKCIGQDAPSLSPAHESVEVEVPCYDLRRTILAKDPLCASNAFRTQVLSVLAPFHGLRMCLICPHCSESATPCMDASVAREKPWAASPEEETPWSAASNARSRQEHCIFIIGS